MKMNTFVPVDRLKQKEGNNLRVIGVGHVALSAQNPATLADHQEKYRFRRRQQLGVLRS
jgi:hypothetical protein